MMKKNHFLHGTIITLAIGLLGVAILIAVFVKEYAYQEEDVNMVEATPSIEKQDDNSNSSLQPNLPKSVIIKPTFDTVRISPQGDVVIAGQAIANKPIILYLDGKKFGNTQSNDYGEWVFVPDNRLEAGQYQLSLAMKYKDNDVFADDVVLLVVPEQVIEITNDANIETGNNILKNTQHDNVENTVKENSIKNKDAIAIKLSKTGRGAVEILSQSQNDEITPDNQKLILSNIGYDIDKNLFLTGQALAGHQLHIILSGKTIQILDVTGNIDDNSLESWSFVFDKNLNTGFYQLDLILRDNQNIEIARYNTPLRHEKSIFSDKDNTKKSQSIIIVQPGNSLWRIASNNLGQGIKYHLIFELNKAKINDPDLIYPGQVFILPNESN